MLKSSKTTKRKSSKEIFWSVEQAGVKDREERIKVWLTSGISSKTCIRQRRDQEI